MNFKKAIVDYYDDVSSRYDIQHGVDLYGCEIGIRRYYRDLIERFVPAGRVLDIGCGTGKFTALLHEMGREVCGLDISRGMLEMARRRVPGIEFKIADCETLDGIADASVDAVTAFNTFSYYPDKGRAIQAVRRVLKPSGVFFDLDMNGHCPIYWLGSKLNLNEMKEWFVHIRHSVKEELVPLFERGGFEVTHADTLNFIPNAIGKRLTNTLMPLDTALSSVGFLRRYAMRVVVVGRKSE